MLGRICLTLGLAVGWATAVSPPREPRIPTGSRGGQLLTFNDFKANALGASLSPVQWIRGLEDGHFISYDEHKGLLLGDARTAEPEVLVPLESVPNGYYDNSVSDDLEYVLWTVNYKKQFRHSFYADYIVQNTKTGWTAQVGKNISVAEWSPTSRAIAYVKNNNVFVFNVTAAEYHDRERSRVGHTTTALSAQMTHDGSPQMFYGINDWVYEEEVAGKPSTFVWSPDGSHLLFQGLNDTLIPTFDVPYYLNNSSTPAPSYPEQLEIRYPKAGIACPKVSLHVLNLASQKHHKVEVDGAYNISETVLLRNIWAYVPGQDRPSFIYKVTNRNADEEKVFRVDVDDLRQTLAAERTAHDGWINPETADLFYVGRRETSTSELANDQKVLARPRSYFVGISDESGWAHIYLYDVEGVSKPIALTKGNWEVKSISYVDTKRKLVYFLSKEHSVIDAHLYSVSYGDDGTKTALVDDSVSGTYDAHFSAQGDYYLLRYLGPDVPYSEFRRADGNELVRVWEDHGELYDQIKKYNLPKASFFDLQHPEGFNLSVKEILPPNFSPDRSYPVLFTPYGGPNSQSVVSTYSTSKWVHYIASDPELEFISYTVDGRGTGYRGREFRSVVTRQLGLVEPQDQIWAAKELIKQKPYLDADRVGMWGWSYGGYLTAKTIEANDGTFSFGLITAPVTDWRFYDSIYTERYMKKPSENEEGYKQSAVHNATGFRNIAGGFAIFHGTGDDNVHYQNTAVMTDFLISEGVGPSQMKVMPFTDSDHSIQYGNDMEFLYKLLSERLYHEKKRPIGEKKKHQWTR